MGTSTRLRLWLDRKDGDAEIAELRELLDGAGARDVAIPLFGDPAPGLRGTEEEGVADVVATLVPELGFVERIVTALRTWLARRPRRTLKLTIGDASIELSGYSTASEDQLVKTFVQHVTERAGTGG